MDSSTSSGLSERGNEARIFNDSLTIWEVLANAYDKKDNPNGYISLGVAENTLMHDMFLKHAHEKLKFDSHGLTYGDGPAGSKRVRSSMARFLTNRLRPVTPIKPEHITVTNGCTSAIEHLSYVFANPGEAFLLGQPYYGSFKTDITFRTAATLVPVPFGPDVDPMSTEGVAKYEAALKRAQADGTKVVGMFLCNPHNPLGRCYSREALVAIMHFCEKNNLHLISDEIYALSIWKNSIDSQPPQVPFTSVLSLNQDSHKNEKNSPIIDPKRLHVLWGMSKDFGANGIRLGAIISQHNEELQRALNALALYTSPSSLAEHITANVLDDDEWVDAYLAKNSERLAEHYALVAKWAKKHDIEYMPGANAAFFLWVNLGRTFKAKRKNNVSGEAKANDADHGGVAEKEQQAVLTIQSKAENTDVHTDESVNKTITKAMLDNKVFLASGLNFGAEADGWFRLVFSNEKEMLEEGLRRLQKALGIE